ncbi:response regulator [Photobacterium chitinilyticum]|uniref:histidine kinase n=1 Tax=Photobacterium chitinilyticum TaxID=2485123 RepID=A0A3S3R3K8_9GAMM|nr:response regulator [Photobacterium chitinilyticum]RWX57587.1 response regulator [Photobacterium chitinilyticum]
MIRFADFRIRPKLVGLLVITGVIPMVVAVYFSSRLAADALIQKSFDGLTTIQSIRKGNIEDFFNERLADISVLADSERVTELIQRLNQYERGADTLPTGSLNVQSHEYTQLTESYTPHFEDYVEAYGYSDLYILDADHGHVMFSLSDTNILGTNLTNGIYRRSGLADAWRKVTSSGKVAFIDFLPYGPLAGSETSFIAQPLSDQHGKMSGVLVLQLSPELITRIVDSRIGMGQTGESYLIGVNKQDGSYEFRSNMETMGNGRHVVGYSVDPPLDYWHKAVETGVGGGFDTYKDSAGVSVLVSYNKVNAPGVDWYLISKMNENEVIQPTQRIYQIMVVIGGLLVALIALAAVFLSRAITQPLIEGMRFAQAIAKGELTTSLTLPQKDELGDLAKALNNMANNLQEQHWLKSGKEALDDQLRGDLETADLATRFITFFSKHMGAQLGALYLLNEDVLELQASYAFTDRRGNFNRINLGEGMVGQAAFENEIITFSNIADNVPAINYGAGEVAPQHFMAIPVTIDNKLIGAVLLGTSEQFTKRHKDFVEQVILNTGIMFNAANNRQVIRELLEKAQRQQEELRVANEELEEQTFALKKSEEVLQTQQEELRVSNEELEEQAKVLKESEAELQAQQEELRVTNEELEERTKALEEQKGEMSSKNEKLVQAQEVVKEKARELEVASKYKSEFLANMSHELRTPLNSILILSQLFANNKDGNLTDKQVESANAINSSGSDLLSLINEILDLSKIEAGKVDLFIEEVGIDSLIKDLNRIYKDIAKEKGVPFELNIAQNVAKSLRTDSQRLQQILRNLLTNAFKFTHEGAVQLAISRPEPQMCKSLNADPDSLIQFSVIDDGIGIAKEKQIAIFQAFQQADGSTSRNYGGTGLGLSITKELTHLLGGTINLESQEGKGSIFSIVLPLSHEGKVTHSDEVLSDLEAIIDTAPETQRAQLPKRLAPEEMPEPHDPVSLSPVNGGGMLQMPPVESEFVDDDRKEITSDVKSLLIIEDDCAFAKIMRDFGRERGFKCIVAEDGESGLHFADYYKPSAIILDIGLPGIDGWTVMERLKDNSDLRHIPVHFMSANDSTLDAMRMGAIGYLTKPVDISKMEKAFGKIEDIISKPVSRLLVVEDDDVQRESIKELIGDGDVSITAVGSGKEALLELENGMYDCMVLDLGLGDMSGFELLECIRKSETAARVPIIIYTGRDLTRDEEKELNRYAESIIIKGVKSPERLLDESALFLHRVEANLPEEQRDMLKMIHDKEAVLNGKTMLLVDDDMRNVFALSSVLEEKGMEVLIARNGLECLDKLKEESNIDGILMDIMMPKMDGYEAMREIRKQREFAKLPIIALTAKAMKGDRSKCIEAGASDYLAKPVDTDKLLSMLRVWLY